MSKLYQRYIGFLYAKNFFVIFVSLEFFYVWVDFLSNLKKLPSSANLQLLYIYFNAQVAVNYTLPLGLVFAMIVSKMSMVKSNELISLYTSTVSRSKAIYPIFLVSCLITLILIGLNFTSFAYANNYKSNLLKYNSIQADVDKIFVKFDEKYVYIDKLNPLKKEAINIKIFQTKNNTLEYIISAKKAHFKHNAWHIKEGNKTTIPQVKNIGDKGLVKSKIKNEVFLRGFKPKTMDTIHKSKSSLSIVDAYDAWVFLSKQNANVRQVKSILYNLAFFPLFAPLMAVILFFYIPASGRFFNLNLLSFSFIFITLCVWGSLFLMGKFAYNGVVIPEIGIVLPLLIMGIIAFNLYHKNNQ